MNWEKIDDYHKRAKIRGGWLVKAYESVYHPEDSGNNYGFDMRVSMCFVPDPVHAWQIDE